MYITVYAPSERIEVHSVSDYMLHYLTGNGMNCFIRQLHKHNIILFLHGEVITD